MMDLCPKCLTPFEPFIRGQVVRSSWTFWRFILNRPRRDVFCLICSACKNIVGYEPDPNRPGHHGSTRPVRAIIGAGPPSDVYDECRSGAEFCTDPRCPEWYREVKP